MTNTGTESIKASDYLRPISFAVEEGVRIIEAEISDQQPTTIDAKIQAEDRKAMLVPTLLNSKDSLVIKLLIANFNGAISADARIEGVELKPIAQLAESRLALAPIISAALRVAPAVVGIAGIELALKSTDLNNDYKRPK